MMKSRLFIPAVYAAIMLFCHSGLAQNPIEESLLVTISKDSFYNDYIESKIALGLELLKIGPESGKVFDNLIGTLERRGDICNLSMDALETIQGGLLFQQRECARIKAWENLKNKYPIFENISKEDRENIYKYYIRTHPQDHFIQEIAGILQSKN